jgi:Tfp pilus assembly protein PilV
MQRNGINKKSEKLEKPERCEKRKRYTKRFRGVTITEVVIATGLLAVAMVPMLKALTSSHVNNRVIEQKSKSVILAQSKLEQIRAESIYNFEDSFDENSSKLEENYLCKVSDKTNSNLKKISVSVGYDENENGILQNKEIDITLNTYIARRY